MTKAAASLFTSLLLIVIFGCSDQDRTYTLNASIENQLDEAVTISGYQFFANGPTHSASFEIGPNEILDIGSMFIQPMNEGGNITEILSNHLDLASTDYISLVFDNMKTLSFQYDSEPLRLNIFDYYEGNGWLVLKSKRKNESVRFYITEEHKALAD